MSKQDRQGVRTAPDLERKYDFGQISSVRGLTAKQEQTLNQMQQSISQYIADTNAKIGELNGTIDGLNARIDALNINNADINDQTPTYIVAETEQELTSGEKISVAFGKIAKSVSSFINHLKNKENPHNVTLSQLKAFGYKRVLTSDDDLNTLIEEGVYPYSTASLPKNCPYANAGVVEVVKADSDTTRIIQRVTRYGIAGATSFRTLYENNWNAWTEASLKSDAYYKVGDTFSPAQYCILYGYITTSTTQLYLFVPLSKTVDIANVTGATVTSMNATIRGVKGYVGDSGTNFTDGSYSFWCKPFENGVLIRITKSEAFSNATNNTPVAAQINSLTLKFT